jgi:hypothetical protein
MRNGDQRSLEKYAHGSLDIHSRRRNRLDQKLVEKLVLSHTNLVLRESLDDTLRHLLPWDIELVIDEPIDEHEEERKFNCGFLFIPT